MRIRRTRGGIGEWTFCATGIAQLDRDGTIRLAEICQRVAVILEEARLLRATKVILFGETDRTIVVEGAGRIVAGVKDYAARTAEWVAPEAVHVVGDGVVFDEQGGEHQVPDLTWINASVIDLALITIATQSDVWMKSDLRGRPHAELFARNRGRLSTALQSVAALGLTLSEQETTDFAKMSGFELENFEDDDGSASDVLVDETAVVSETI